MSSAPELLALRKEVLRARCALQRLTLASDAQALRDGLRWPRAALAVAASPATRSLLFTALVVLLGRSRVARVVRTAALAIGIVRLVGGAFGHGPPTAERATSPAPQEPV